MRRSRALLSCFLYNGALTAVAPFLPLQMYLRARRGKAAVGLSERLGRAPGCLAKTTCRRVWIHAASVGEVMAITPVLKALSERSDNLDVVLTTITPGGHEVASGLVGGTVTGVSYAPLDFAWAVRSAVRRIQPDVFVGVETEIWPNLLRAVTSSGAKAVLVNGRLSDRSYPRYLRVRWFLQWPLSQYASILAQSPTDAARFIAIGAPRERVEILGNAKFDQADEPLGRDAAGALRAELRIAPDARVLVVGSTRVIEEERLVWRAYMEARKTVPNLALIHAPRHVDRAEELVAAMREHGLAPVRRTQVESASGSVEVLVLDTFGELGRVYALGNVAFIGNSLVPPGGGQNLLQPLAQGVPVLYGPYMANFRDAVALAEEEEVGVQVGTAEELSRALVPLLSEAARSGDRRERALALIARNRGAALRYAERIAGLLPPA